MKSKSANSEARFAYEGLDRVIHERARLSVLTSLIRHLSVLENAKMVEIIRGHDRNRPQTICRITASGRKRYLEYLTTLEQVVRDAANGAKSETAVSNLLQNLAPGRV